MGKKIVVLILAAALALGALALTAGATEAGGYEVGYAKVDINPYWHAWMEWSEGKSAPNAGTYPYQDYYDSYDLMPLPMAGYGNNDTRLSRPKLMDDNGSGVGASKVNVTQAKTSATATRETTLKPGSFYSYVYANNKDYQDVHLSSNRYTEAYAAKMGVTYEDGIYGENDGDGVWATCVLVKDPQTNSYLLVIGIDNIGIDESLNGYIRDTILKQTEVKMLGLTADRILINANHTHGSVALGTKYSSTNTTTTYTLARNTFNDNLTFTEQELYYYLNFYKNYIRDQLAAATVKAIQDLETAVTMEKGTIDAGLQMEHHMNGVRHNVQTYKPTNGKKPEITYVRGSSFNNDMDGNGSHDSNLAGNGFSASAPVSESDDHLHILKFTFENKEPIAMVNFRAHSTANNKEAAKALHYNISADWVSPLRYELEQTGYRFSLLYGNSGNLGTGVSADTNKLIEYDQAYYSQEDGYWIMPATPYGRAIAQAARALLGEISEKNDSILDPMHKVSMGEMLLHKTTYLAKRQTFTPLAFVAAAKFMENESNVSNNKTVRITVADGETATYNGKTVTATKGGTIVIGSKYHATSILGRYGATNKTSLELNTVRLGKAVAFYTTPIEASDRYFTNTIEKSTDILANASKYNDWWKLNEPDEWGVPFDLSLTNGSSGYITNELAYDYGKDYTGTDYVVAIGSYESQNSNTERGEGEKIVERLNEMLRNMGPKQAYCEACGAMKTWQPLNSSDIAEKSSEYILAGGHYYLGGNFNYKHQVKIKSTEKVCLDLNGFTYTAESHAEAARAFNIYGTLNVMDHSSVFPKGVLQGQGVSTAVSEVFKGGTLLVNSTGTVNLYSGTLTQLRQDGYAVTQGGVVQVEGGMNIYGGYVTGGVAANGGNIYVEAGGMLVMHGGELRDGVANKASSAMGGNVYCGGSFQMEGGSISGGSAYFGGNVQVQGASASFTMTGGKIFGGKAGYEKPAVADLCTGQVSTGTELSLFRMEGGYIEAGIYSQGKLILTGTNDGDTPMYVYVKVPEERLFIEGQYTGNIIFAPNDNKVLSDGAKVGNVIDADFSGATIQLKDYPAMELAAEGDSLLLRKKAEAYVNGVPYATIAEAVSAYNSQDGGWLKLNAVNLKISGVTRDLYLDLNGNKVASINTGGHKLIGKDSATDDYSSSTTDSYGSLPIGTSCQAADGYLATMVNNRTTFHKYTLELTHVNLRPSSAGIYYTSVFRGDEAVQVRVNRFGVALSLDTDMTRQGWIDSITQDEFGLSHVWFSGEWWTTGQAETNGVLVRNIMKQALSAQQNKNRANRQISGVSYVQLRDGTWLFGETVSYSLQDVVETINDTMTQFPDGLLDMYRAYEDVMSAWKTDRIAKAAKGEKHAPALEILEKVWSTYTENEKFTCIGGDLGNPVENGPGALDLTNSDGMIGDLPVPAEQLAGIADAASLYHGLLANNFTCGVFRVTGDAKAFGEAMKTAVMKNEWVFSAPEKVLVSVIDGEYVLVAFGMSDLIDSFQIKLAAVYPTAEQLCIEKLAQ